MKTNLWMAGLVLFAASSAAAAPKLHLKVITSPPEGVAVNSTLIYGEKDAILIDAQFRLSDAHRLVAAILESRKNLTTVYVTHPHPDHYFGLVVIRQAFPNARFVALPKCVEGIKASWENRVKAWKPQYGDDIPSRPIIPDALEGNTLTLEGDTLQIFGPLQGDSAGDNSFVWIPSLKAVVGGDTLFSGVHFVYAPMAPAQKKEWMHTVDQIAALKPEIVVPGHEVAGAPNDASVLAFMKKYMRDSDEAQASSKTADAFLAKMKNLYPNLGLDGLLNISARVAFPAKPAAAAAAPASPNE
ncbi:MAG TPA: MBL fold metallo-hydrolase [Candidatus Polarisedimenticolia bacterium]|nr:MBL fold metallo-hydrolase [Candidatus Polarisedimenticolia bacterium]